MRLRCVRLLWGISGPECYRIPQEIIICSPLLKMTSVVKSKRIKWLAHHKEGKKTLTRMGEKY
jgi:hypothetical protein